ncbi:MAG: hypothetical protein K0Q79_2374 [Flavipsychrobacter sp.]|jgi:hypothetical protein|nr:hypothetical protein [Flavipsychrobacter sp.]
MNNFNNVFLCIKKHCHEKGMMHGTDIFEKLSEDTKIPVSKIEFILTTLQNLELIKFSLEEHYIKLTPFGKKQERLFTDS